MKKLYSLGLICMIALLAFSSLAVAQNPSAKSGLAVPVTGSFAPSTTSGTLGSLGTGTFAGTLNIQQFVNQNGNLTAVGTLVGTLTNATGQVTNVVINRGDSRRDRRQWLLLHPFSYPGAIAS